MHTNASQLISELRLGMPVLGAILINDPLLHSKEKFLRQTR